MQSKNSKNYIALFLAVFIWSSAFIVSKFALTEFGPLMLCAIRILVAFIVLLPFAIKRGFSFAQIFTVNSFIYGIFGYGGNLVLLSLGLLNCSANISAIIHGLFPVFMILFGTLLIKEKLTKNKFMGILLSVIGVFIASIGDLTQNSGTTITGIVLVVLSVFTWAFYSVYSKKHAGSMDTFVLSEICFGSAFICTLPLALVEFFIYTPSMPNSAAWLSLVYLGAFSGAFGILLWNYGLKKVDSGIAGIYFNLMPVIGLAFAFFIGEQITFLQVSGCVLILAGVMVCSKRNN